MDAITGGIELTGTLYTSAQGNAKDKLAMAQQIYDNELSQFQSALNKKLNNVASGATADSALSETEINAILI